VAPKEVILGWINQYRHHPEPDKVPLAVRGISRLGLLTDTEGAGVYVGSWLLLGGQTPGLSGVMSYTARGDHVSVNVNGRFAMLEGRLALIVDSAAPDGAQQLRLKWIEPDQLVGSGTSKFSWGPQGPVELKRPPVTR